jgi:hypothetical protein
MIDYYMGGPEKRRFRKETEKWLTVCFYLFGNFHFKKFNQISQKLNFLEAMGPSSISVKKI